MGIGLALARRLVELHGGRIEASNPGPDQGSTFTSSLPLTRVSERTDALQSDLSSDTISRRVVIIDNNQDGVRTQMRVLIGFRPKTYREVRLHACVLLVLDTGLRISEALGLRDGDIDMNNLVLKVFGKGQKERLVPCSPELRRTLYRLRQLRDKKRIPGDYVFAGFGGVRWEKRNATTSLHLLLQKLQLPRFGWHRLRHTFATNYLRHGGDIVRLAMVFGHSQITTTQRYLHLLTRDLVAAQQRTSLLSRLHR